MVALRSLAAPVSSRSSKFFCHPGVERLEGRLLMAGLDVPQLSSRPGAAATIYLDFDGHTQASWGAFSNITSPAYDRDGDATTFSATELTSINDIWTRVAEDFAPFNVNVTTVEPPSFADGVALRVVIGGKWADWYGAQANGVSLINSFSNSDPNVAYVFSKDIGSGFPKWVSEQVSHEAGHALGLMNQSSWNGNVFQSELNSGSGDWAPIMGTGNFAARTTWYNGATDISPTSLQDDMAIIAGPTNGFGYVADDYGDTLATASSLPLSGSSVNLAGLIGQTGDQDVFKFTTAGGDLSFNLAVARVGANLDSALELRDANGQVVTIANDATSGVFTSALTANVASGTYYLVVRASGGYGNVGQYTLTGTIVPGVVTAPEISVLAGGVDLASGGSVSFGSTLVGTPVTQTFTVQNLGNGNLTLAPLDTAGWPAGFSLLAALGSTTLTPGQSTTFTVQLDAAAAGTFGGTIHVLSNDADESSFDVVLGGAVTAPVITAPEIRVWAGATELASGDGVNFGSAVVGTPVTQTFTIQNVGDADLVLSPDDPSSLPAGFSLLQVLGATTLHPTDCTTFVVQFNAAATGLFGGTIHVLSNDADESSFGIVLAGVETAPEISVFVGSDSLETGGTLDFGATQTGTPVTRTVSVRNVGDATLTLSPIDPATLPAGFTLVSNLVSTTLAPGETTTFTIRLDATAAGSPGGTIHILNSDGDEGSFDIVLKATVADPAPPPPTPVVKTIDNGAAGFTAAGKWHVQKNKGGVDRDIQFAEKAGKKDKKLSTATWTFAGLDSGQYRVSVSFLKSPSYAKDAPFSVLDGTTLLSTVLVNEKGPPPHAQAKKGRGDANADNVSWQDLGTFAIQGGSLVVQLTNRASGHVVADAVRIERVVTAEELLLLAPPAPAPALTPQQQSDSALEQTLLDNTNELLDQIASDVARQSAQTTTATY